MKHTLSPSEFASPNAADKLANHLLAERTARNLKGFWMDYCYGEVLEFKRDCPGFRLACEHMVRAIQSTEKGVEIYRNGNGQLTCCLKYA